LVKLADNRDLQILLPMVIDPHDVDQAIEIIERLSTKHGLARRPEVGVMIETPAAVVLFDRLVEMADFISIGTNDLTQYLLAADRGAIDTDEDYSVLHPAVLRTIRDVVAQSRSANKPVSVCGEAAGDPHAACLLAGLGVRQLSMSPVRAAPVRQVLRSLSMANCVQLAHDALNCAKTSEVHVLLGSTLADVCGSADRADSFSIQTDAGHPTIGIQTTEKNRV